MLSDKINKCPLIQKMMPHFLHNELNADESPTRMLVLSHQRADIQTSESVEKGTLVQCGLACKLPSTTEGELTKQNPTKTHVHLLNKYT